MLGLKHLLYLALGSLGTFVPANAQISGEKGLGLTLGPIDRRAFFCDTASLGTRIALTKAVALRLELRGRAIELDWFGNTASESLEYTGGVQWTFNAPERSKP